MKKLKFVGKSIAFVAIVLGIGCAIALYSAHIPQSTPVQTVAVTETITPPEPQPVEKQDVAQTEASAETNKPVVLNVAFGAKFSDK